MRKVVAIIPIKLNNERLANKNLKAFDNGKPLISYVLNTLLNVKLIDEVYVFCSQERIIEFLPKEVKFLKRSEKFDTSNTTMNEILQEFSKIIESEIYVLCHATAPFISSKSIAIGIDKVLNDSYDSSFSAEILSEFLWSNGKPLNYSLTNIPRTQDLPKIIKETSGFYIFKKELIQKNNRRIGDNPYPVIVNKIEAIDIDEEIDFTIANAIYNFKILKENI